MNNPFTVKRMMTLALTAIMCAGALWAEVNPKPFVVPELKEWKGAEGHTALSGRLIVKSSKLRGVAQTLASDYEQMTGKALSIVSGSPKPAISYLHSRATRLSARRVTASTSLPM